MPSRFLPKLPALALLCLTACFGSGYRESRSEAWVLPTHTAIANLKYAVLPVQFAEDAIPVELFKPWRRQRELALTVHLRRELEDALRHGGFTLTDRESLGLALANVGPKPAAWTTSERDTLAADIEAEAVVTITMLEAGPTRLKARLEATRISDGVVIWRCERTDIYGTETPDQGQRLINGLISRLRLAGLPLRR